MEEKKTDAFGIVSLVCGGLALFFEILAIFGLSISIGIILSIASIILGIISLCHHAKPGLPIIGIIISVLTLFFSVIVGIILIVMSMSKAIEIPNDYGSGIMPSTSSSNTSLYPNTVSSHTAIDEVSGYTWVEKSDSLLQLNSLGSFRYYKDKNDLTDYYYTGTYEVYVGQDAIEYITEDLQKYGVTKQEIQDLLDRNPGYYSEEQLYCIVLNNQTCMINGTNTMTTPVTTPYYGFMLKSGTLSLVNMNSATRYSFTKEY